MSSPSSTRSYGSASMSISSAGPTPRECCLSNNSSPFTRPKQQRHLRSLVSNQPSPTVDATHTSSMRVGTKPYTDGRIVDASKFLLGDVNTPHTEGPVMSGLRVEQTFFKTPESTNCHRKYGLGPALSASTTASLAAHSSVPTITSSPNTQTTATPPQPSLHPQTCTLASDPNPHSLRDLHLAIGQHRVQYLPTLSSLTFDEAMAEYGYLPIAVRIGSYLPGDDHPLIGRTYSIWAYQTTPLRGKPILGCAKPHAPIELTAFNQHDEHINNVPGIGPRPSWANIQQHIQLHPEFALVRSSADLACLVRYALLLAADSGIHGFNGANIPLDIGFPHQLVEIGERGWYEERFRFYEAIGVLPGYHDRETWEAIEKENLLREEEVKPSASESSGEDEIPAIKPERVKGIQKTR